MIGAISKEFDSNVRDGDRDSVVFEAGRERRNFLNSNPYLSIVTNVEPEHMEYYDYDEDRFYEAYRKFLNLAEIRVINMEDRFLSMLNLNSIKLFPSKDIKNIEYVLKNNSPYTRFTLRDFGDFEVFGFGEHIALDASLAILAGIELGESIEKLRSNLRNYRGIKKRFDIVYNSNSLVIIDDYGHHPTEIKATLRSSKNLQK